jgi:Transport and Golgi organisation 2
MCTVTYIPSKEGFFLTSNRDEKIARKRAAAPALHLHDGIAMLYPRDGAAGGTWIAVTQNGNAAVLLNGAFEKHISSPPYQKSRGLVFLEIMISKEPYLHFLQIFLDNIEPFTLVLSCNNNLYECVWDGSIKHHRPLNKQLPQIWSSTTLYEDAVIQKRQQWFTGWLKGNARPSQNDILQFHQFTGDGDVQNDLLMNRDNILRTVSITGIECTASKAVVKHYDLFNTAETEACLSFEVIKQAHGI